MSCDACLKGNFRGRRYKCLICYDYDLCASCYESGATTTRHTTEHPMQCILTRVDFGKWRFCLSVHSALQFFSLPGVYTVNRRSLQTCEKQIVKANLSLLPLRPVLWGGSLLGGTAPGLHLSLLWQDGLHRDLSAGACGCRAHRDLHRSGEWLLTAPTLSYETLTQVSDCLMYDDDFCVA